MACGEHGRFAVEKGQNCILPINVRNKEGRYILVVYALRRIFNTHKSVYISYKMKAEIIYFVSIGYISLCEQLTNLMAVRQMPHKRQCIFDASIGYFAGGPLLEKFYRIFTALVIIVAYEVKPC